MERDEIRREDSGRKKGENERRRDRSIWKKRKMKE
jgi:hypothetical protein